MEPTAGLYPSGPGGVIVASNGGGVSVIAAGGVNVAGRVNVAGGSGFGGVAVGGADGVLVARIGGRPSGWSVGSGMGTCGVTMMTTGNVGTGKKMGGRVGNPGTRGTRVAVAITVGDGPGSKATTPTGGSNKVRPGVRSGLARQFATINASAVIPRVVASTSMVSPSSTR